MNKAELIAKIAEDAGLTKTQANAAVDSFTTAVQKNIYSQSLVYIDFRGYF